jgi:hypothetical protein
MDVPSSILASTDRLPACVVGLGSSHATAYVLLRLRKNESQIAMRLGVPVGEAEGIVQKVRHELAREGLLWHVEDPEFFPIHAREPDGPELPLAAANPGAEEQAIVRELVRQLGLAVDGLPLHQAALLRLKYRNGLSAREIREYISRTGTELIPGKTPATIVESDVFYALNAALKGVLGHLKRVYGAAECQGGIEGLKEVLEEIGPDF